LKSLRAERVKISKGAIGNNMRKHRKFSEEFKKATIQKLLSPGSPGPGKIAEDLDLYPATLYNWKKKYANSQLMTKSKKKKSKDWTPEQMLEAIIKTSSMTEQELGEYLRTNGMHSSDLEAFKNDFINLKKEKKRGRPQLDPELVKLRKEKIQMERNLRRNEKALAEYAARVILLKKSHEIWGTNEDDE
jgi:transposase-like protein